MDKIQKALAKFSNKEKAWIKDILKKISISKIDGLDIKKLKGHSSIYRVRKGKIRIIYRFDVNDFFVLAIERRNDNTYDF